MRCPKCGARYLVGEDDEPLNEIHVNLTDVEPTIGVVDAGLCEMEFTNLDTGEVVTEMTKTVRVKKL